MSRKKCTKCERRNKRAEPSPIEPLCDGKCGDCCTCPLKLVTHPYDKTKGCETAPVPTKPVKVVCCVEVEDKYEPPEP